MNNLDLLVFTQYPSAYAPKRLKSEAERMGLSINIISYKEINLEDKLLEAKCVIFREPNAADSLYELRDNLLKKYLSKSKILNQESYLNWSILDKLTQHKEFEKGEVPHIKLLTMEEATYPFIVKSKLGSHGSHVFKIENEAALNNVLSKGYKKEDLLVQEFQTSGFDLRVIVLGGGVLGAMKRTPKTGGFLSNYSQGGSVEVFEMDNEIKSIAVNAAKYFKLDFVGVDLMKGNDGEWKVLEVNRACQFQGFEKATGINVSKQIINFLIT